MEEISPRRGPPNSVQTLAANACGARGAIQVRVTEVFQVEPPLPPRLLGPCGPASAGPAGQLLPDPLDLMVDERVSRAVQSAIIGAAHGSVPTDTQPADEPPKVSGPQSGAP